MTGSLFGSGRWPAVDAVELIRVALPLVRSHVYSGGEERDRNVVLVRAIDADGAEGWGECSALSSAGYLSETTDTAWTALRDELAPAWLRDAVPSRAQPMAYAGLEMAALDLDLRSRNLSLIEALAELFDAPRPSVEWCAVLGLQATLDDVDEAVRAGASQVKCKVSPTSGLSFVEAVRAQHPELSLAVDANGSFTSADRVPDQLADLGLAYVEQPVPADDLHAAAAVAARSGVAVALDESITSSARLLEAIELGSCQVVSVKAPRLGGLEEAVRTLEIAQDHGLLAFVGGMLETGVGRAAALALASQSPCTRPCDVGPTARYFDRDIAPPFVADDAGHLHALSGPGLGVTPDPEALTQFGVELALVRT